MVLAVAVSTVTKADVCTSWKLRSLRVLGFWGFRVLGFWGFGFIRFRV